MIHPDAIDPRDHIYVGASQVPPEALGLLDSVLRVENQTTTNSCVAQAATSALECIVRKFKPAKAVNLSPLFFYYVIRAAVAVPVRDVGTSLRFWMKQLKKVGVCPDSMWPFDPAKVNVQPPPECYKAALKWRIKGYARVPDVATMRAAIAAGLPVVFALNLRKGFIEVPHDMALHGEYLRGCLSNAHIGWHEMLALGYRADGVISLNSWGVGSGQKGYVLIPYEMMLSDMGDAWVITGVRTWLDGILSSIRGIFG